MLGGIGVAIVEIWEHFGLVTAAGGTPSQSPSAADLATLARRENALWRAPHRSQEPRKPNGTIRKERLQ